MVRFIRKLKLEFPSLNGLLHCILTYLRGEIALVPGAASIPEGTSIELNLTYPDADEPVIVRGVSQGLDPAGRGLRLRLDNPQEVDQVTMLLGHLHLGPYAARKLMAFVRQQQDNKPRLLSQVSPVPTAPTTSAEADGQATSEEARNRPNPHLGRGPRSLPSDRDRALLDKASDGFRSVQRNVPSSRIQPPRMRPPTASTSSTAMPTRRTQMPGGVSSNARTEMPKVGPRSARPASPPPTPSQPGKPRRPPISSDRMPGLPRSSKPRPSPAPPTTPQRSEPAPKDQLDQTQMVRLDDMDADLGSLDDY